MTADLSLTELVETESTNSFLLSSMSSRQTGEAVYTWNQKSGRGRHNRPWIDVPGKNLAVSCVLPSLPEGVPATWVPLLAGWSAQSVLKELGVSSAALKWPNDVLVGSKKLAGILVEVASDGRFVVGIGINVLSHGGEAPIQTGTTLEEHGVLLDDIKHEFIRPFVQSLLDTIAPAGDERPARTISRWKKLVGEGLETVGRLVVVETSPGVSVSGIATGLSDEGGLIVLVKDTGDEMTIHSGDVFHIERS